MDGPAQPGSREEVVRAGVGAASSTPEDRLESAVAQALEWGEHGEEISADRVRQAFPDCWAEVMAVLGVGEHLQNFPARHLGSWKLLKRIGGGAQTAVYLARAETAGPGFKPGSLAALKIVRRGGAAARERLLYEADLASRLAHPNLVRVLYRPAGDPAEGDLTWVTFEYVQGQTLREVLDDLGRLPEVLVRRIALEVARALGALHAAGLVHGDVKPENVILGDAGVLKLLDLGAAYLAGEPHAFAGTLPYAAPEQLRGEAADGRADLYGLGVTIYEILAGRHPFEGLYASQLVRAKLERAPPPLRSLRLDVSPLLAAVVDRSLSREAKDRPPSAEAVAEVLERGEDSTWVQKLRQSGWEPEAAQPAWMAGGGPSIRGREKELASLEAAWSHLGPRSGRTVLVEGAPGIGKSCLVETFLRRCVRDERAAPALGAFPLGGEGAASESIGRAIGLRLGPTELEKKLAALIPAQAPLVPALAAWVRGEAPPTGVELLDAGPLRACVTRVLRGLAATRPFVFAVEDLHLASPEALDFLAYLARALERDPVLLVLTSRPGLSAAWREAWSHLSSGVHVRLGPLDPAATASIVRDLSASEPTVDLLAPMLVERCAGNPLFIRETLAHLRRSGTLVFRDGLWQATGPAPAIAAPTTLQAVVRAWISVLAPEERDLLDVAALLGQRVEAELVARVLGWTSLNAARVLGRIAARLALLRVGPEGFSFAHHLVMEELESAMSTQVKMAYHGAVAEALEAVQTGGQASAGQALAGARICHHLTLAGRSAEAWPRLLASMEALRNAGRSVAAMDLAALTLAHGDFPRPEDRVEVALRRLVIADQLGVGGGLQKAEEIVELAGSVGTHSQHMQAQMLWADTLVRAGRHDAAHALLERLTKEVETASDQTLAGPVAVALTSAYCKAGSYEDARVLGERALATARTNTDKTVLGSLLNLLGIALRRLGRTQEAQARFEEALAIFREHEPCHVLGVRMNVALHVAERDLRAAWCEFQKLLPLARAEGNIRLETSLLGNMAVQGERMCGPEEALEASSRAVALARESGDFSAEVIARGGLASRLRWMGNLGEALPEARRFRRIAGRGGFRAEYERSRLVMAELRGMVGRRLSSYRMFRGAIDRLRAFSYPRLLVSGTRAFVRCALSYRDTQTASGLLEELALATSDVRSDSLSYYRGVFHVLDGDGKRATSLFRTVLELQKNDLTTAVPLLAAAQLARMGKGDVALVRQCVRAAGASLDLDRRVELWFLLWEVGRDPQDLECAYEAFSYLLNHAPPMYRQSMKENVPLYRDLCAAWASR